MITPALYVWFVGVVIAACMSALILLTNRQSKMTRWLVNSAIGAIVALMAMFLLLCFSYYIDFSVADGIFYRIMVAISILLGVLIVLSIISHRLYVVKHPQTLEQRSAGASSGTKKGLPTWGIVLIVLGAVFFGSPIIIGIISALTTIFHVF
jgi:FlaA1/EpsC-like NDP-sugar epimerase